MKTRTDPISWRLFLPLAITLALGLGCSAGGEDPKSPEQVLLDKAIGALWGDRAPSSVESVRTTATSSLLARSSETPCPMYQVVTYVGPGGRYRETRTWEAYGITEVQALWGDEGWASVDATVVPFSEESVERLKLQSWLARISRLAPLKNTDRFALTHAGRERLEDGTEIERLRVVPKDVPGVELALDFAPATYLLHRVTLSNGRDDEEQSVVLTDYRDVDGVQMAHLLESLRDGIAIARQEIVRVEFNVPIDDASFRTPVDLNRDAVIEKRSVGGLMACAAHAEDPEDVMETVEDLKTWIAESGLQISGPLVVIHDPPIGTSTRPSTAKLTACIAVSRAPDGSAPKPKEGFELREIEARPALCLTHVGDSETLAIIQRLRTQARTRGFAGPKVALEVFFSPDRKTRQIQLPLE